MRIVYVAGREEGYSRTRIVYKALQSQGFDVIGCFPPDKSFKHYPALMWRAARAGKRSPWHRRPEHLGIRSPDCGIMRPLS